MIIAFCFVWQWSHGNVDFIYFSEVCTDIANGIVLAGLFGSSFLMCFFVTYLVDSSLGLAGTFYLYAATSFIGIFYNIFVIKETKGLSSS
jgi:hypothetical protein